MNKIALGTVQFGFDYGISNKSGKVNYNETKSIIELAKRSGLNTLDTAHGYGDSEKNLGKVGIDGWKVISKLPAIPNDCKNIEKWAIDIVEQSLDYLKVSNIEGLLLHHPSDLFTPYGDALYKSLIKIKRYGLTNNIGISIYNTKDLNSICASYDFDIIQAPMNVIDWRLQETGLLCRLKKKNIEIHVRSVFLQGLLLMPIREQKNKFPKWDSLWDKWDLWLKEHNISALQACLGHVIKEDKIDKVIVGVNKLGDLAEILKLVNFGSPNIPRDFICNDIELINPMFWSK